MKRLPYLVLAAPFAVMVVVLRGMTATLPIFHGSDEELYHYPTILRFSHQLPFPDLHAYHAAQTPLYHLLFAYIGQLTGYELWRLRLIQVVISYLLVVAVYRLLARRLGIGTLPATALALLFALSPYVFGQAFRLGTDNLALLLCVLALDRFEHFREARRIGPFAAGTALTAAAILTRQSTAFMVGVALLYAWFSDVRPGERGAATVLALLAAVPAGLLFLNWHGLVPVGGDTGSCGLCAARGSGGAGLSTSGLQPATAELALASIGLYGAILFVQAWWTERNRHWAPLVAGAAAGLLLVALFAANPQGEGGGVLWKIAEKLPQLDGSSLLFWVLVPLAGAVLAVRLPAAPRPLLAATLALTFVLSMVVVRFPWQKYTDPLALLVLLVTVRTSEPKRRSLYAGAAILSLMFVAYTADFSAHGAKQTTASTGTVSEILR